MGNLGCKFPGKEVAAGMPFHGRRTAFFPSWSQPEEILYLPVSHHSLFTETGQGNLLFLARFFLMAASSMHR